ncbi:uncharacterized protein LOC122508467 [Leptopilina heterotoma]|uniref:uncharacterized protein LOC122508467 n=1 Tax=Leptopilina heterotoma TaxID=63436 RepID=UPI001CA86E4A|nr:uncharacterized protein LOC122508467 [Leptopilina heterotoma]
MTLKGLLMLSINSLKPKNSLHSLFVLCLRNNLIKLYFNMFKLFAFLALLAVAFAAPAPAPAILALPAYDTAYIPAALPLATSSQSIVQNHNSLKFGYAYSPYSTYLAYPAL